MKSWLVLFVLACVAWYFTDVTSSSPLHTLAAPLLLAAVVIIAICKIMATLLAQRSRANTAGEGSSIGLSGNNEFGGDGGSSD